MNRSQADLAALVFGAGIGSLATEIAASRMLAPYFGSSTIVWANLIGIVLAGLAVGYWLGGKLADRRPERRLLGLIVLAAARLGGVDAVRGAAIPRCRRRQPRRRVRRRRDRLVLRRAAPVRACRRPARDGLAVRDPARDHRRRERGRGRRPLLRALHRRLARRDLRAGADRDPARRDAADAARDCRAAGRVGLLPARQEGDRAGGGDRRARSAAAGSREGGGGTAARGGLALPVHPGDRARRRAPAAAAERGRRGPLRLARGHGADRRRLGRVPGAAAAARPADPERGDPRQRWRHHRAGVRPLLPRGAGSTASSSILPSAAPAASTSGWRTIRT